MSSRARKLTRPLGAYNIRLSLSLRDTGSDLVSYVLQIVDPRKPLHAFFYKVGQTTTGTVISSIRIKVPTTTRVVQIRVDANDAVGNTSAFSKTIRLK